MTTEPVRRELHCLAERTALRQILSFVDSACADAQCHPSDSFDVKLAVEEICTNVIEHGYEGRTGPIDIEFVSEPERYVISIRDHARPFPPEQAPAADLTSAWEERPIGGLGWHLIRNVVDTLEYASTNGDGNRLTFTKQKNRSIQEGTDADLHHAG